MILYHKCKSLIRLASHRYNKFIKLYKTLRFYYLLNLLYHTYINHIKEKNNIILNKICLILKICNYYKVKTNFTLKVKKEEIWEN